MASFLIYKYVVWGRNVGHESSSYNFQHPMYGSREVFWDYLHFSPMDGLESLFLGIFKKVIPIQNIVEMSNQI